MAGGPGALQSLRQMNQQIDARHVLSSISAPTLVLHPVDDDVMEIGAGRYIADHVPGAEFVELPGKDHGWWVRADEIGREAERFIRGIWDRGEWDVVELDRILATVLFTDIIESTTKLAEVGDRRWRELLHQHHALVRRQLVRFAGREIDTAGDGFFASFDGPARAIRCACAITKAVRNLGLEVRAGLHTGECELVDGKMGGIAVHIGARVAAKASPGEVLVSSTVKDLVAGSGIRFSERGAAELKGIPGEWRLYSVDELAPAQREQTSARRQNLRELSLMADGGIRPSKCWLRPPRARRSSWGSAKSWARSSPASERTLLSSTATRSNCRSSPTESRASTRTASGLRRARYDDQVPTSLQLQGSGQNREGVDSDLRALGSLPGGAEHHDSEFVLTESQPR